jgi:hypothetical protein
MNETEGMGTVTYVIASINVELTTRQTSENLLRCETFIAAAYDDGHAWSGERITSPGIIKTVSINKLCMCF